MSGKRKRYGQYFTPGLISDFMVDLIDHEKNCRVLDPAAGKGVFLSSLVKKGFENIAGYEIDGSLENKSQVDIKNRDYLRTSLKVKFDVIIGNPPYVRWRNIPEEIREDFEKEYWENKINGLSDLLYSFLFRSVDKLREEGELIFLTPTFWLQNQHASSVRDYFIKNGYLDLIVSFNEMKICKNASTSYMVFKFIKDRVDGEKLDIIKIRDKRRLNKDLIQSIDELIESLRDKNKSVKEKGIKAFSRDQFSSPNQWPLVSPENKEVISKIEESCKNYSPKVEVKTSSGNTEKINLANLYTKYDLKKIGRTKDTLNKVKMDNKNYYTELGQKTFFKYNKPNSINKKHKRHIRLGDIAKIGNGLVSGLDKAFKVKDIHKYSQKEKQKMLKVVKSSDLNRFYNKSKTFYLFPNEIEKEETLKKEYPNFYNKLKEHKTKLEDRYDYGKNIPWWHWVFLRNWKLFKTSNHKIFVPSKERVNNKGFVRFTYVQGNFYPTQDVTAIVKRKRFNIDIKYILGFLNSKTLYKWILEKNPKKGRVLEFPHRPLSKIPIRLINWSNEKEIQIHNEIAKTVKTILEEKNWKKHIDQIEKEVKKLTKTT
ncbi:MAG: Adenine-specific DNA methylase [Candidatus Methanohalarchaeum thermophilum]|uniref:site-specific DNA-methyltransferase (adenine-specific) n=1 Tax=Methanohalarchaeum thermophilum TaxID=1903181 RepID=A0A1Q6DVF1_METT1|nr:MAG: Adenine-specific DNA methylase [Candidatus Methanohalarchaeum thermophilum]